MARIEIDDRVYQRALTSLGEEADVRNQVEVFLATLGRPRSQAAERLERPIGMRRCLVSGVVFRPRDRAEYISPDLQIGLANAYSDTFRPPYPKALEQANDIDGQAQIEPASLALQIANEGYKVAIWEYGTSELFHAGSESSGDDGADLHSTMRLWAEAEANCYNVDHRRLHDVGHPARTYIWHRAITLTRRPDTRALTWGLVSVHSEDEAVIHLSDGSIPLPWDEFYRWIEIDGAHATLQLLDGPAPLQTR